MTAPTIYTWGYSGRSITELIALRDRLGALVVDTRYVPRSRRPEYNRRRLEAALGADYVWLREFGNLNYKGGPHDPVRLNEPEQGLLRLRPLITPARPPLLICQCPTTFCHRVDVAAFIADKTGAAVEHL